MAWFSPKDQRCCWQYQAGSPGMLRRELQRVLPVLRHLDPAAQIRLNGERIDWNLAQQWAWLPARWGRSWNFTAKRWQLSVSISDNQGENQSYDLELLVPEQWLSEVG